MTLRTPPRRLRVLRVGTGSRAVVLLHGFLGSGRNLLSLARRWSDADPSRLFLLPDLTGHGTSPRLPAAPDLEDLARDVALTAVVEGVGGPFEVVGHSLGGRVGLVLRSFPEKPVARLTLLDISPGRLEEAPDDGPRSARALLDTPEFPATRDAARAPLAAAGLPPPIVEWLLTNLVPKGDGYAWRFDREGLAAFRGTVTTDDLWPLVGEPGTLSLIRGGTSAYVPSADVERARSLGVRVETVDGAGHFVHVDRPAELLSVLRDVHR